MLRAHLLGGLALSWNDEPLPPIPGRRARSLLAYLLTYREQPHTRDLLAGTFWSDLPDAVARRRLSQALWQIRKTLEPHPVLLTEGDAIQLNPSLPLQLDVEEFSLRNAKGARDGPRAREHSEQCVELYQGEFLAGHYDDWAVVEREQLREVYLEVLGRLVAGRGGEGASAGGTGRGVGGATDPGRRLDAMMCPSRRFRPTGSSHTCGRGQNREDRTSGS